MLNGLMDRKKNNKNENKEKGKMKTVAAESQHMQ